MGNVSHYNSSGRTGCHLGALRGVFVGHGSCFGELDGERAKGLFPRCMVPAAERPGLSSSITAHWEGGQTPWVGWGEHNREMYNMDMCEPYVRLVFAVL